MSESIRNITSYGKAAACADIIRISPFGTGGGYGAALYKLMSADLALLDAAKGALGELLAGGGAPDM